MWPLCGCRADSHDRPFLDGDHQAFRKSLFACLILSFLRTQMMLWLFLDHGRSVRSNIVASRIVNMKVDNANRG